MPTELLTDLEAEALLRIDDFSYHYEETEMAIIKGSKLTKGPQKFQIICDH